MILTAYWISKSQFLLLVGQMEKTPKPCPRAAYSPAWTFGHLTWPPANATARRVSHVPLSYRRACGPGIPCTGNLPVATLRVPPTTGRLSPLSTGIHQHHHRTRAIIHRALTGHARPAHGLPAQQAPHRMRTLGTLALSPFSLTDGRTTRPADLPTLLA